MKTLLKTIENQIADVELEYQEECFRDYGSRNADYLLGVLGGLYRAREEIKERLEHAELAEKLEKLDQVLNKMVDKLKGV